MDKDQLESVTGLYYDELSLSKTVLPDLERFNKEMTPSSRQHFRCTLLPPSESLLKDSRLEAFAQEMERIIFPG